MTGHLKAEIASAEVDNPLFSTDHAEALGNPRRISVFINVRTDAVTALAVRGLLEPYQVAAANRFRQSWEVMAGIKGNVIGDRINRRQQHSVSMQILVAGEEQRDCRELLGYRNYVLVAAVCGEGRALSELFHVKRERLTAADTLRTSLDDIAGMWGYMQPQPVDKR